jgi:hypothetical protein
MDLVELGARFKFFLDLEFLELGVFGYKKMEWSCFFESGAIWSPAKHALNHST